MNAARLRRNQKSKKVGFTAEAQSAQKSIISNSHLSVLSASVVNNPNPLRFIRRL
jgi:hypothetical protein